MIPLLVKLGDPPVWFSVTLPPVTLIVPLLTIASLARPRLSGCATLMVPRLFRSTARLRAPPGVVPPRIEIVPPAAFVSVPVFIVSCAPYAAANTTVSSIVPLFVKLFAMFRFEAAAAVHLPDAERRAGRRRERAVDRRGAGGDQRALVHERHRDDRR